MLHRSKISVTVTGKKRSSRAVATKPDVLHVLRVAYRWALNISQFFLLPRFCADGSSYRGKLIVI
jgi:hypothetical protein